MDASGCYMSLLSFTSGQSSRLECSGESAPAKNWVPIPHGDELYWIHTISPYRVLRTPAFGGTLPGTLVCDDLRVAPGPQPRAGGRGSSAACLTQRGLLVATHARLDAGDAPAYTQGLLAISPSPPFAPLEESPPFQLVGADDRTRQALAGRFHFVNGLACAGDEAIFTLGVDDRAAVIVSARLEDALALLRPLRP